MAIVVQCSNCNSWVETAPPGTGDCHQTNFDPLPVKVNTNWCNLFTSGDIGGIIVGDSMKYEPDLDT